MLTYPMWVSGIQRNPKRGKKQPLIELIGQAVAIAAKNYHRKFERWPNRAMIRKEEIEPIKELRIGGKIEIPFGFEHERGVVMIEPVSINWQKGIVGVYCLEDPDENQKSKSHPVEMSQ